MLARLFGRSVGWTFARLVGQSVGRSVDSVDCCLVVWCMGGGVKLTRRGGGKLGEGNMFNRGLLFLASS